MMPQPPTVLPLPPAREGAASLASARQAVLTLDKAVRATRTYGATNNLSVRFFDQLYAELTAHLAAFGALGFTVRRDGLHVDDEPVLAVEEGQTDALPARLHADGVREVAFQPELTSRDLRAFLRALAAGAPRGLQPEKAPAPEARAAAGESTDGAPLDDDDDIVTRLWSQDISTITFVTAEEVAQAPWLAGVLAPQERGFFAAPPATFREIAARERASGEGRGTPAGTGPGAVGYEVSEAELAALRREMAKENATDPMERVLRIYEAILHTERDPELLARALDALPGLFQALLREARWARPAELADEVRRSVLLYESFGEEHRARAAEHLEALRSGLHLPHLPQGLAEFPDAPGLPALLERLEGPAVPRLLEVLAAVKGGPGRREVLEALARVGLDYPDPVYDALAGADSELARELLGVVVRWDRPQTLEAVTGCARHPDPRVRADAVTALLQLRPEGDGAPFMVFAGDPDRAVRLRALGCLTGGRHAVSWASWRAVAAREDLHDLPAGDKRALFHALRLTCGDQAVPWWRGLLGGWGLRNRQKKEETALMAVDALRMLATPAALAALEEGRSRGGAVRQACADALAHPGGEPRPEPGAAPAPPAGRPGEPGGKGGAA